MFRCRLELITSSINFIQNSFPDCSRFIRDLNLCLRLNPFSLMPFNNESPKIVTLFLSSVSALFFDKFLSLSIRHYYLNMSLWAIPSVLWKNQLLDFFLEAVALFFTKVILSLSKVIIKLDFSILSILLLQSSCWFESSEPNTKSESNTETFEGEVWFTL